jgi:hypothetical protein
MTDTPPVVEPAQEAAAVQPAAPVPTPPDEPQLDSSLTPEQQESLNNVIRYRLDRQKSGLETKVAEVLTRAEQAEAALAARDLNDQITKLSTTLGVSAEGLRASGKTGADLDALASLFATKPVEPPVVPAEQPLFVAPPAAQPAPVAAAPVAPEPTPDPRVEDAFQDAILRGLRGTNVSAAPTDGNPYAGVVGRIIAVKNNPGA